MTINLLKIAVMIPPNLVLVRMTMRRIWIPLRHSRCSWGCRMKRRWSATPTPRSSACRYKIKKNGESRSEDLSMNRTRADSSPCSSIFRVIIPKNRLLSALSMLSRRWALEDHRKERSPTWLSFCSRDYRGSLASVSVTYAWTWWR